jgi:hypothetical protein
MYLVFAMNEAFVMPPVLIALWMVGIGALMISRVRTPSVKRITIAADYARYVLVGSVVLVAALLTYPVGDTDGAVQHLLGGDPCVVPERLAPPWGRLTLPGNSDLSAFHAG